MYHGTHVAGIAAGSKVQDSDWNPQTSKTYQGIAPGADIATAAVNSEIKTDGSGLQFDNSLQAFSDIFSYAEAQQKPCVINYSMGDAMSFSDNRALASEAISTLLSKPGRALVVSSGNSGSSFRLAHKTASLAEGGSGVMFHTEDSYGQYLGVELKVLPAQTIRFRKTNSLYSATAAEYSATASELATKATITCGKTLKVVNRGTTTDGYQVIYVTSGNATFTTSERILVTIQGEGEAWIYSDPLCAPLEPANTVANHSLLLDGYSMTWPAMLPEVITVGNIAQRLKIVTMANKYASQSGVVTPTDLTPYESTKGEGYLAKSSSVGPTLTGIMKPDVCAPGVNVVSAMNFFIDDDTYYAFAAWDICSLDTEYETWGGLSGYFHMFAQTGSSMSAPVVTGTIALWMQADPTLTTERIKDILAHSCRQPDSELSYPNNQYGYGEVNAYAGMQYLQQTLGIEEVRSKMTDGRSAAIYDLQGRKIAHGTLSERTLSKGLYIVNGRKVAYR
jgi:subtilisin family serine protease